MNYCFTHAGKFSCAVDCFLELTFAVFKDSLNSIERNEFFQKLSEAIRGLFSIRCHAFLPTNGLERVTSLRTSAWEARYRGILVYNICLISIRNSVSDGATNKLVLNIER